MGLGLDNAAGPDGGFAGCAWPDGFVDSVPATGAGLTCAGDEVPALVPVGPVGPDGVALAGGWEVGCELLGAVPPARARAQRGR